MQRQLQGITRIPVAALQGTPLYVFSVNERMSWAENRQTAREEDKAYSLFGIFDIQLPLLYDEGRDKTLKRLREEIYKPSKVVLKKLQSVENATFDSYAEDHNARCYQGTRVQLLQQIDSWVSDLGSE